MTPASPTWDDVTAFLAAHGWLAIPSGKRGGRRERHVFYEKTLDDGRVLQTHVSKSGSKTISPGRFSSILRHQLEVSKDEFWECIRTGQLVDRPVGVTDELVEHDGWVLAVLVNELHMSAEEVEALTPAEAERLVHEHWSRPR